MILWVTSAFANGFRYFTGRTPLNWLNAPIAAPVVDTVSWELAGGVAWRVGTIPNDWQLLMGNAPVDWLNAPSAGGVSLITQTRQTSRFVFTRVHGRVN